MPSGRSTPCLQFIFGGKGRRSRANPKTKSWMLYDRIWSINAYAKCVKELMFGWLFEIDFFLDKIIVSVCVVWSLRKTKKSLQYQKENRRFESCIRSIKKNCFLEKKLNRNYWKIQKIGQIARRNNTKRFSKVYQIGLFWTFDDFFCRTNMLTLVTAETATAFPRAQVATRHRRCIWFCDAKGHNFRVTLHWDFLHMVIVNILKISFNSLKIIFFIASIRNRYN